jgi:hypothetical protein
MVLVLAILGGGLAGLLGLMAWKNTHDSAQIASLDVMRRLIAELEKTNPSARELLGLRAEVSRFDRLGWVSYVLFAVLVSGLTGGVLAFLRRGKTAAAAMFLPVIIAGALAPPTLIFTAPLTLAALLALLVKSPAGKMVARSADEEPERSRPRPKRDRAAVAGE